MTNAEEVIAEQILDKVFYPSFDAQERTEDLKASQEFREDDVFGIHEVTFNFENNSVEFKHEALSREAFAMGAISAAKFMSITKPDIYKFSDIF